MTVAADGWNLQRKILPLEQGHSPEKQGRSCDGHYQELENHIPAAGEDVCGTVQGVNSKVLAVTQQLIASEEGGDNVQQEKYQRQAGSQGGGPTGGVTQAGGKEGDAADHQVEQEGAKGQEEKHLQLQHLSPDGKGDQADGQKQSVHGRHGQDQKQSLGKGDEVSPVSGRI